MMRKDPVDSGQSDQRERASRQHQEDYRLHMLLTPVRIIVGVVALALVLISVAGALIITTRSDAATTTVLNGCTTTSTPTAGSTATSSAKATATPHHHKTPVATPTDTPDTPTDTPTPVPPTKTPTPVPPTATPTSTPVTPVSTSTPQSSIDAHPAIGSIAMLSANIHLIGAMTFNTNAQCTATTTPAGGTQTPDPQSTATGSGATPGITPATTSAATTNGSTPGTTPVTTVSGNRSASSASGSSSRVGLIAGSVFVLLLVGLGVGWFLFRRMLLPANAPNTHLPPSGARPWSRTRVPSPDSVNGQFALNGEAGGSDPNIAPASPMNNNYNGPDFAGFAGTPDTNGAAFSGFSDGFIPSSPQIFPQHENSMIPPGSGAFPVIANANGITPASPAFNAMYGLPDDPFAASQGGTAGWMANLGNSNGFNSPPTTPNGGANLAPDQADLNDPYLAEVIRQYSQKSQTIQQMSPNNREGL